ncbi:MAG: holo-[acyl-carrier-protein] synthase [Bacteroidia bacterium]|nr:holo-[acyl-carrier-protein] synthase [Bacteroidia bacterium]
MSEIFGIGLDMVEIDRMQRIYSTHGERFVRRFCLPGEAGSREGRALAQHLAGLFAAKEAVLKALGTGWSSGLGFSQVEVVKQDHGAPAVRLHGKAAEYAAQLGITQVHLSITHDGAYASAVAIAEKSAP